MSHAGWPCGDVTLALVSRHLIGILKNNVAFRAIVESLQYRQAADVIVDRNQGAEIAAEALDGPGSAHIRFKTLVALVLMFS